VAQAAASAGAVVPVHIKVDTGMGRAGFQLSAIEEWADPLLAQLEAPSLQWAGLFTHPHSADEARAPGFSDQLARFERAVARLDPPGEVACHLANSAAAFLPGSSDPRIRGVRAGIFLYGGGIGPDLPRPESVVTVRARVVRVVQAEVGDTVGYGATHTAREPERWVTLGIGYGDGIPRVLSHSGSVLLGASLAPIIGRISMDLTVVRGCAAEQTSPGDIATVIGSSERGDLEITLDDVAQQTGRISWEVLTSLSPRLPRIWDAHRNSPPRDAE